MGRGDFHIVTHPDKAPAVDFLTRSSIGPFIDTGVDVMLRPQPGMLEHSEHVYIALATIQQFAQMLELNGSAKHDPSRDAGLIAQGKLEAVKEHLDGDTARLFRTLLAVAGDIQLDRLAELALASRS